MWRPTKVHTRWLGLLCCRALRCRAYEWGMQKPETPPLDRVYKIPGLESITFTGKMHSMPRLARPVFPSWDPDWMHLLALLREHLLHKDQVCYTFHQCCRLLEGVKQALWLNKTKLIEGLPEKVPSLTGDPRDHTEDQDEPVLNAISHAHLWHSTEDIPKRVTYCSVIVDSLMQLCKSQILKHSSLTRQIYAPKTCDPLPGNKSLL